MFGASLTSKNNNAYGAANHLRCSSVEKLRDLLRQQTLHSHMALHSHPVLAPMLIDALDIKCYQKALRGFQNALHTLSCFNLSEKFDLHGHLENLTQDLSLIAWHEEPICLSGITTSIVQSKAWQFGIDYVVVGSGLGAKQLAKTASQKGFPCLFFSRCAKNVAVEWGMLWQNFQSMEFENEVLIFDQAIEGALWAFNLYRLSMDRVCYE
jgi:heme oxygenase